MKVNQILTESGKPLTEIKLDFNDLTSIQIGALRAIDDGRLDFDNASDRMMDVIYELQNYNLVNDMYELTPTGQKAVALAYKLGGAEKRKASAMNTVKPDDDLDLDDDNYDDDSYYDDEDNPINRFNEAIGKDIN